MLCMFTPSWAQTSDSWTPVKRGPRFTSCRQRSALSSYCSLSLRIMARWKTSTASAGVEALVVSVATDWISFLGEDVGDSGYPLASSPPGPVSPIACCRWPRARRETRGSSPAPRPVPRSICCTVASASSWARCASCWAAFNTPRARSRVASSPDACCASAPTRPRFSSRARAASDHWASAAPSCCRACCSAAAWRWATARAWAAMSGETVVSTAGASSRLRISCARARHASALCSTVRNSVCTMAMSPRNPSQSPSKSHSVPLTSP
mmetsp:Transcript_52202/g.138311  ORF Transcript_52202/g.138311 Transcript_52202/m.138311 type:complete len:267 (+) Transcript_52202:374-1174(+)